MAKCQRDKAEFWQNVNMKSTKFWQNVNAASEVIPRILSGDSFEVKRNLRVGTDGIGAMTPRLCKRSADNPRKSPSRLQRQCGRRRQKAWFRNTSIPPHRWSFRHRRRARTSRVPRCASRRRPAFRFAQTQIPAALAQASRRQVAAIRAELADVEARLAAFTHAEVPPHRKGHGGSGKRIDYSSNGLPRTPILRQHFLP